MATNAFAFQHVTNKPNCGKFSDSKNKNKHYKAHVLGVPANKVGAGDMANLGIINANDYEARGMAFINSPRQAHQFQVVDKDGNCARWDPTTFEFAVQNHKNNNLLTYHRRTSEQFAVAVFERAVLFYAEGSKGAQGTEGGRHMGEPNEWLDESGGSEFDY